MVAVAYNAGHLRERVWLDQRGLDANGDRKGAWETVTTVWARIVRLKGSEPVIAQRLEGVQPAVITVRSSPITRAITTAWRAVDVRTGQEFNIQAVTPDEKRKFIDILVDDNGLGGGA